MNLIINEIIVKKESREIRFLSKNDKGEPTIQGAILINRPSIFLSATDAGQSLKIEIDEECQTKK